MWQKEIGFFTSIKHRLSVYIPLANIDTHKATWLHLCRTLSKSVKKVISIDYFDKLASKVIYIIQCHLYPETQHFYLFHISVKNFMFKNIYVITVQIKIHEHILHHTYHGTWMPCKSTSGQRIGSPSGADAVRMVYSDSWPSHHRGRSATRCCFDSLLRGLCQRLLTIQ